VSPSISRRSVGAALLVAEERARYEQRGAVVTAGLVAEALDQRAAEVAVRVHLESLVRSGWLARRTPGEYQLTPGGRILSAAAGRPIPGSTPDGRLLVAARRQPAPGAPIYG
jgi:hypothetical protein